MCTSCLQRRAHNALCSGFLKFAAIVRDFPLEGCLCGVPSRWAEATKNVRAALRPGTAAVCEQVSQSRRGGDESSCLNGNLQICKLDICQEGTNASAMTSCDFQLAASVAGLQFRAQKRASHSTGFPLSLSLLSSPLSPSPLLSRLLSHHLPPAPPTPKKKPHTHAPTTPSTEKKCTDAMTMFFPAALQSTLIHHVRRASWMHSDTTLFTARRLNESIWAGTQLSRLGFAGSVDRADSLIVWTAWCMRAINVESVKTSSSRDSGCAFHYFPPLCLGKIFTCPSCRASAPKPRKSSSE